MDTTGGTEDQPATGGDAGGDGDADGDADGGGDEVGELRQGRFMIPNIADFPGVRAREFEPSPRHNIGKLPESAESPCASPHSVVDSVHDATPHDSEELPGAKSESS